MGKIVRMQPVPVTIELPRFAHNASLRRRHYQEFKARRVPLHERVWSWLKERVGR